MEQLTLLREGSRASPLVSPDEKRERKMTVTSGRRCLESYKNLSPLGLLVKMLLTSSIWHSAARKLTWKVKGTKCNHLLFQLAVSGRPIDEIERSLLHTRKVLLYPTPRKSDATGRKSKIIEGTNQRISKAGIKAGAKLSDIYGNLNPAWIEWLMGYQIGWTALKD